MLKVEDLAVHYIGRKTVRALEEVSIEVKKGEIMGVVGESGSGKTTLGLSILKLLPPNGRIVNGRIYLDDLDITSMTEEKMREIRGKQISMVFQDPMTSLDPLMSIGDQITETITTHEKIPKREAEEKALSLLEAVGISGDRFKDFPHQLSGGMRQRVMIAMALSLNPKLIVADEPTTALDVIVQDQIMDLFRSLRERFGVAFMFISHDLSLELEVADRIAVMYGGWLMELSESNKIAEDPLSPYTKELLAAIPNIELEDQKLRFIPGNPPDLSNPPSGCRFHPRCPSKMDICSEKEPPISNIGGRVVRCWLYGG
ncbi:ABC transporter ATP-binding protein [Candidatus Methanodesulfokora washburnensis]|uniref:ABC transporter ATP-binding protein n=2 Tax=Candidatus Methanodesulfokora washburnensis TaxID=2478471 RepID=A0A3R9PWW6_9CREN|nr:ABC transporter ATP-binding protein [Candidatus Methanodesulfokores washburnensis]RSN75220.1 ABC transporter ATP-binding protein [Candidatus Methanodesulfokores washburnensis]